MKNPIISSYDRVFHIAQTDMLRVFCLKNIGLIPDRVLEHGLRTWHN